MTRIAYLVSSARDLTLEDGSALPAGYGAEEALVPYEQLAAAGFDVTVITPDGRPPIADAYGLSWFFHYPKADADYLASMTRTFARDADGVRVTLQQSTELGLAAARRVAALRRERGESAAEAHRTVSAAARTAWREGRSFVEVVAENGSPDLTPATLRAVLDDLRAECERLAEERVAKVQAIPGFRDPVALSSVAPQELNGFDAVFVPGGYGPMSDLYDNPDAGRLLEALHSQGAPIAALSHGPAVLLSARERADGLWLFDGFRMTCTTDEEEDQTEAGRLGMAWRLDAALKNTGAVFDDGPTAWVSHVVVDRNLITGQNPQSTDATVGALLTVLNAPRAESWSVGRAIGSVRRSSGRPSAPTETVEAFLDAVDRHDIDRAMRLLAPRVSVTVHPLGVDRTDTEALREVMADLLRAFPDLMISISRVIETGNVVTALLSVGGTQTADYAGVSSMNKHLNVEHAWRFVVAGGLITDVTAYWCQAQVYRRLAVKRYDEIVTA